jgi:hypothetical protein
MVRRGRGFFVTGGTLALPVVVLAWSLAGRPDLGSIMPDLADSLLRAEQGRKDRERLDERLREAQRRFEAKRQVAWDLIEGKVTLTEAAARARALDRASDGFGWESFRTVRPGASDEELHCREVIDVIRGVFGDDPERYRPVTDPLEEELQRLLDSGTLTLPEVSAPALPTDDARAPCRRPY